MNQEIISDLVSTWAVRHTNASLQTILTASVPTRPRLHHAFRALGRVSAREARSASPDCCGRPSFNPRRGLFLQQVPCSSNGGGKYRDHLPQPTGRQAPSDDTKGVRAVSLGVRRCAARNAELKARQVGSSAPRVGACWPTAVRSVGQKTLLPRRFAKTVALRSRVTRHVLPAVHVLYQRSPRLALRRGSQTLRRRPMANARP
jgi:hypothetical protein